MGLEPTTTGITIRDSTAELQPPSEKLQITKFWKPEANCFRNLLACPTGIEPVTPSLEGWCSIRLSYGHHSNRAYPESIGHELVGVERFELPTSWSQTRRATRLRYTPERATLYLSTDKRSIFQSIPSSLSHIWKSLKNREVFQNQIRKLDT